MSIWYVIDGLSWCIDGFKGQWLFSIRCGKRQVACREARIFQLFNKISNCSIEISNTFINAIWIIVSIWFVYDLAMNNKFINSVAKVFFACVFKICFFLSVHYKACPDRAFMLFPQMINNSKYLLVKNGKIDICNESCYHCNYFKIINVSGWELCNLNHLRKCRRDCKAIQMKVIKYYRKP